MFAYTQSYTKFLAACRLGRGLYLTLYFLSFRFFFFCFLFRVCPENTHCHPQKRRRWEPETSLTATFACAPNTHKHTLTHTSSPAHILILYFTQECVYFCCYYTESALAIWVDGKIEKPKARQIHTHKHTGRNFYMYPHTHIYIKIYMKFRTKVAEEKTSAHLYGGLYYMYDLYVWPELCARSVCIIFRCVCTPT